jgi:hypothetical protein
MIDILTERVLFGRCLTGKPFTESELSEGNRLQLTASLLFLRSAYILSWDACDNKVISIISDCNTDNVYVISP